MAGGQTFIGDMQRWRAQSQQRMEALARQSIQELCFRIQSRSPVLTGFFIANWQPSIGKEPPMPTHGGRPTPGVTYGDKDAAAELAVVVQSMRVGQVFFYVNNARYGMRLEYGFTGTDALGRYYNQAGKYFVRKSIADWPQIVAETAADLRLR